MKSVVMFAILTSTGVFLTIGLAAWERSAMQDCKSEEKQCKKDAANKMDEKQCKMDAEDCKKNATQTDEDSFENSLSPYAASQFRNFTPDQRKRAMDYAHGNKMDPDDAVTKVNSKK